jgi:hypothetical protein
MIKRTFSAIRDMTEQQMSPEKKKDSSLKASGGLAKQISRKMPVGYQNAF